MKKHEGFSLLEIALALLIIGLVIGGVVVGKTLVRSAQLREAMGEYDRYLKAIHEFQAKYQALPGDMSNATSFWGEADADPGLCLTATGSGTQTCNGNGNGHIGGSDGNWGVSETSEWTRAWQHLSNAGFIDGAYNGLTGTMIATVNVPASKLKPAVWRVFYHLQLATDNALWADEYGHVLNLGNASAGLKSQFGAAVLTGSEALDIDSKMDDGKPGTGKIRSLRRTGGTPDCTENDTSQTNATYATSDSLAYCSPFFILGL